MDIKDFARDEGNLRALLANCRDYWHTWAADAQPGDVTFRSGVDESLTNGVRRVESVDDGLWDRVSASLAGVPWMWWVASDSPAGVADHISAHGATKVHTMPVLAAYTDQLPSAVAVEGLVIREVSRDAEYEAWVGMWAPASGLAAANVPAVAKRTGDARLQDGDRLTELVGTIDGEIVASAVTFEQDGIAGIYVVSTKEQYRNRGIGRALTASAIDVARASGTPVVTLQSTDIGLPVYLDMGFQRVSTYDLYVPPAAG